VAIFAERHLTAQDQNLGTFGIKHGLGKRRAFG
jgi:hypothetical protein